MPARAEHQSGDNAASEADRQRWMGILARAPASSVTALLAELGDAPAHDRLRGPEPGLVMVRGRAGGSGPPFNLGEMTVTRCSVRLASGNVGHSYVAGRDGAHAEAAAVIDALLLDPDSRGRVTASVIDVLDEAERGRRQKSAARAAATKVDFFTMVRGDD